MKKLSLIVNPDFAIAKSARLSPWLDLYLQIYGERADRLNPFGFNLARRGNPKQISNAKFGVNIMLVSSLIIVLLCQRCHSQQTDKKSFKYFSITSQRNIFKPLWRKPVKSREELEAERRRKEELERVQSEEESAKRKEERRLEEKKKELKQMLRLTGVVFNGTKYVAFVENVRTGNKSAILSEGDIVEESKVVKIDGDRQEVTLDFEEKFTIILRLQ